jgi:hypothetical protein
MAASLGVLAVLILGIEQDCNLGLKKRTFNVCFAPRSGHKWVGRWMSAYDPKRTLGSRGGGGLSFPALVSGQLILEGIKLS